MTANLPLSIGVIHFIGIGGIGMSGIAEVLKALGYNVSGSDIIENSNVIRLRKFGIKISIGHKKINVIDAKIVVVSSAIDENNEELWGITLSLTTYFLGILYYVVKNDLKK